jgi:hypothetical protein
MEKVGVVVVVCRNLKAVHRDCYCGSFGFTASR